MKQIKITGWTVHPQTREAAAAVPPLVKHLQSLSTAQLLNLFKRAKSVKKTFSPKKKVRK